MQRSSRDRWPRSAASSRRRPAPCPPDSGGLLRPSSHAAASRPSRAANSDTNPCSVAVPSRCGTSGSLQCSPPSVESAIGRRRRAAPPHSSPASAPRATVRQRDHRGKVGPVDEPVRALGDHARRRPAIACWTAKRSERVPVVQPLDPAQEDAAVGGGQTDWARGSRRPPASAARALARAPHGRRASRRRQG